MAKGGFRPGAGRPKGSKSKRSQAIAALAISKGKTPLEVMLKIMRDADTKGDVETALQAAHNAAPYVHPRLNSVQHAGDGGGPVKVIFAWQLEQS